MSEPQLRILEGVVTTLNDDGSANVAPMGPKVDQACQQFVLRPFQTSRTYQNLARSKAGVLHVTDDVELLARAAIGRLDPLPAIKPAGTVDGVVLCDACRWYEFEVTAIDDRQARTEIQAQVVATGRHRDFFGFNRAKHAVLEAAILATRVNLLPWEEIQAEFARLAIPVAKTAGPQEEQAFRLLSEYVQQARRPLADK